MKNTRSYGAAAGAPPPSGAVGGYSSSYGSSYGGRGTYNPDSLFSAGARDWQNDDVEALAADQRSRMLYDNSRLDDHSARLTRAHQTALQSEQIGYEIQGQLREDREKLERAYGKIHDVNDNMKTTRTILLGMSRRVITNKIILVFIILLLLASIGVIIYLKWGRGLIKQLT